MKLNKFDIDVVFAYAIAVVLQVLFFIDYAVLTKIYKPSVMVLLTIIVFYLILKLKAINTNTFNKSLIFFTITTLGIFLIQVGLVVGFNNDLYNWALFTNGLYGAVEFGNIIPDGLNYRESLWKDCFASTYFNGVLSATFNENTLGFAVVNLYYLLIFIFFSVYSFLNKFVSRKVAILSALMGLSSPLFLHVLTNYFFSQLVGYLLLFMAANAYAYKINESSPSNYVIWPILPWVMLIFLSYPAGFLPYVVALFFMCVFSRFFYYKSFDLKLLLQTVKEFIVVILIVSLINYEYLAAFASRVTVVAGIKAGWPLPLLSIFNFFGLPDLGNIMVKRPYYLFFSSLAYVIFFFVCIRSNFKLKMLHAIFVVLYLIYFTLMIYGVDEYGYQIWKGASYIIFPIGMLLLAITIDKIKINVYLCLIITILSFLSFCVQINNNSKSMQWLKEDLNSIAAKLQFSSKKDLLLDLNDFSESFIAINYLSRDNRVYPIARWYGPSINLKNTFSKEHDVITANCDGGGSRVVHIDAKDKYEFYFKGLGCGFLRHNIKFNGLYAGDSTGAWSGNSFEIQFDHFELENYQDIELHIDYETLTQNEKTFLAVKGMDKNGLNTDQTFRNSPAVFCVKKNMSGFYKIRGYVSKVSRPIDLGINNDERFLGIKLKKIKLKFLEKPCAY